jgi:hypothetical protein
VLLFLECHKNVIGGWVGLRAGLDAEARRKILCPRRGSNLEHPIVQPVVSIKELIIMHVDSFTMLRKKVIYGTKITLQDYKLHNL